MTAKRGKLCRDCYWRIANIRGNRAERNVGKACKATCDCPSVMGHSPRQQVLSEAYQRCKGEHFKSKSEAWK